LAKKELPMLLGLLEGYDIVIVIGIIVLLFGGSQLPKLARSLGSASHEFRKGVEEGHQEKLTDQEKLADKVAGKVAEVRETPGSQAS
jgi:sec-independent protein translocase protein TatA